MNPIKSPGIVPPIIFKPPEIQNQREAISDGLYPFCWTGFITRNKKHQVGVDCFAVKGDLSKIFDDLTFNLNISHRIKPIEVEHLDPEIIVVFRASNETYREKFKELNNYLMNKNMLGIVNSF